MQSCNVPITRSVRLMMAAALQGVEVLRGEPRERHAAVRFERAYGCNHQRGRWSKVTVARDDMGEFLEAEVGAEARLRDDNIGELEGNLVREQRVVAVGDVAKGTGMHQRRLALHRLHDVR